MVFISIMMRVGTTDCTDCMDDFLETSNCADYHECLLVDIRAIGGFESLVLLTLAVFSLRSKLQGLGQGECFGKTLSCRNGS